MTYFRHTSLDWYNRRIPLIYCSFHFLTSTTLISLYRAPHSISNSKQEYFYYHATHTSPHSFSILKVIEEEIKNQHQKSYGTITRVKSEGESIISILSFNILQKLSFVQKRYLKSTCCSFLLCLWIQFPLLRGKHPTIVILW